MREGYLRVTGLPKLFVVAVLLTECAFGANSGSGGAETPAGHEPEVCHVAVLRNGFIVQHSRREVDGPTTRLWLCADAGAGYVVIPNEQIERFEQGQSEVPLALAKTPEATASGLPPSQDSLKKLIAGAAGRHQIDPDFVASVVKAESGFNPTAVSPKGARGLMQLMPQTAAQLGVENALDPAANMEGGTRYLRQLLDQYDGDAVKALAAYNAGPQRVKQYGGVPPFRETRAYVARIVDDYNRKKRQQQSHSTADPTGK